MTRKDYIRVARLLAEIRTEAREITHIDRQLGMDYVLDRLTVGLADAMKAENANFKRETFYRAASFNRQ